MSGGRKRVSQREAVATEPRKTYLGLGQSARSRDERTRQETFDSVRADEALEVRSEAEGHRLAVHEFRLAGNNGCT